MALERGVLVVRQAGKSKEPRIQIRIGKTLFNPSQGEVSQSLLDRVEEFDGKEVEFERVSGQPKEIREAEGVFVPPRRQGQELRGDKRGLGGHAPRSRGPEQRQERGERNAKQFEASFHNPYNFVPAPPRNTSHRDLGDHSPVDQSTFLLDRYSGRIRVRMTANTPLLVPDAKNIQDSSNGHKTYSLLVGLDGRPLILASSVRGMLRSAYEAITNSRFGRFSENHHRQKLKYRQESRPYRKMDFDASPWDLLDESLKPATGIDRLSPADRVFGWVKSDSQREDDQNSAAGSVAGRGLLRVGPVICESSLEDAVLSFPGDGVPLAILSMPKPQQSRFYVARSLQGDAQPDGLSKVEAGYTKDKGLRGRKVYPHHTGLPDGHWNEPMRNRTQEGRGNPAHYQEYRRPQENDQDRRDDQNRSILGWVKPRTQFTFEVQVHNLSKVELGALLWLLKLPNEHFFRFGGGKPLGFGSVRLTIDDCDVCTGQDLLARYGEWCIATVPADSCDAAIQLFEKALCEAYPPPAGGFESISFIAAFLAACRGFNDSLPIHYPRVTEAPKPEGESFKWFVANERGRKVALPDLAKDKGLPILPILPILPK